MCGIGCEGGEKGGKKIAGCCYQSEICQSVPSHSTQAATLIPSPPKRLKPMKQAGLVSFPTDRQKKTKGVNFPPN